MQDRLKLELNLREVLIYEIGHTAGMVKREREVQQEIFNYECMYNIKHQDASNGIRLKLHSDDWFAGMRAIIDRYIELINQHCPFELCENKGSTETKIKEQTNER